MNVLKKPNYVDYIDCMIAFVDILGFDGEAMNIRSCEDFSRIGELLFSLK